MIVSKCCHREVLKSLSIKTLRPIDMCSCCGMECEYDMVETCDRCRKQGEWLTQTRLGDWCKDCTIKNSDDLIEEVSA